MTIFSHEQMEWIATIATGGTALYIAVSDIRILVRKLPQGSEAHDEIFGGVIGITGAILVAAGILKYWSIW